MIKSVVIVVFVVSVAALSSAGDIHKDCLGKSGLKDGEINENMMKESPEKASTFLACKMEKCMEINMDNPDCKAQGISDEQMAAAMPCMKEAQEKNSGDDKGMVMDAMKCYQ